MATGGALPPLTMTVSTPTDCCTLIVDRGVFNYNCRRLAVSEEIKIGSRIECDVVATLGDRRGSDGNCRTVLIVRRGDQSRRTGLQRKRVAGVCVGVVGDHVGGDRGALLVAFESATATGPSLVPVTVIVSVELSDAAVAVDYDVVNDNRRGFAIREEVEIAAGIERDVVAALSDRGVSDRDRGTV